MDVETKLVAGWRKPRRERRVEESEIKKKTEKRGKGDKEKNGRARVGKRKSFRAKVE